MTIQIAPKLPLQLRREAQQTEPAMQLPAIRRIAEILGRGLGGYVAHRKLAGSTRDDITKPARNRQPSDRRSTARSEEHTSELQSLMRISYAVFCLKKNQKTTKT